MIFLKLIPIPVIIAMALSLNLFAMEQSFQAGKSFSQPPDRNLATTFDNRNIPGFTANPPEASLNTSNIDRAIAEKARSSEAAQFVKDGSLNRSSLQVDAEHDPLFVEGSKVVNNPEQQLNLQITKSESASGKSKHICTKGQEYFERKCRWTRVAVQVGTRREEKTFNASINGKRVYWAGVSNHYDRNHSEAIRLIQSLISGNLAVF